MKTPFRRRIRTCPKAGCTLSWSKEIQENKASCARIDKTLRYGCSFAINFTTKRLEYAQLMCVLSGSNMSVAEINRYVVRVGHGLAIGVFVLSMMLSIAVAAFWLMN